MAKGLLRGEKKGGTKMDPPKTIKYTVNFGRSNVYFE